jgi:hypothetical protein
MVNIYQLLAHIYINGKKASGEDDDMQRSHEANKIKIQMREWFVNVHVNV